MEIKAELIKPYADEERMDFIVENNHKLGYLVEETDEALIAKGYTEEELAQQEQERIAMLSLTAADVERGIYKAKGMDFDDIIAYIEAAIANNSVLLNDSETSPELENDIENSCDSSSMPQNDNNVILNECEVSQGLGNSVENKVIANDSEAIQIDLKALKIELKANNFYRGNPYVDTIGTLLGVTKKQLDEFFKTNDYTKLCTSETVEE